MAAFGLVSGLIGFLVALFSFIALMCIWGNTGRTANYTKDTNKRLDALTEQVATVNKWIKWYAEKSGMVPDTKAEPPSPEQE